MLTHVLIEPVKERAGFRGALQHPANNAATENTQTDSETVSIFPFFWRYGATGRMRKMDLLDFRGTWSDG
jgi:hypothetical protein